MLIWKSSAFFRENNFKLLYLTIKCLTNKWEITIKMIRNWAESTYTNLFKNWIKRNNLVIFWAEFKLITNIVFHRFYFIFIAFLILPSFFMLAKNVLFTFFYIYKNQTLDSQKFSTSGFQWFSMFEDLLNMIWPFLENVCLSVCLYYFVDTVSQELIGRNGWNLILSCTFM